MEKKRFTGRFYVGAFEFVAIGLGRIKAEIPNGFNLRDSIIGLWNKIEEKDLSWSGSNAWVRIKRTLNLAKELYGQ